MLKVGVFDSGVGGQSVVNAIKKELPDIEIIYKTDKKNVPYGLKSPDELISLVVPILKEFENEGCSAIVMACNTVTTTIIAEVRRQIKLPIVAIEPMVKPAAKITKTGTIAVCATPATLKSKRYSELKNEYAKNINVIEPDCSDWATMVENNSLDHSQLQERIDYACNEGADVIVLGCTHYHWIEEDIKMIAKKYGAEVIQPEKALITQLKRVLEQLG